MFASNGSQSVNGTSESSLHTPRFSILLPTYNRGHLIRTAIDSVLTQSHTDFELIVIDDHSTDDTRDILSRVDDPRVSVVENSSQQGAAYSRNLGISLARGEWLCQIDSDDTWDPRFLEHVSHGVEQAAPTVAIVYGSENLVTATTGRTFAFKTARWSGYVLEQFLADHVICHVAAAIRIRALRAIGGYDVTFKSKEDSDLLVRLTERYHVLAVPEAVYNYTFTEASQLTDDKSAFLDAYDQYLAKHTQLLDRYPTARYKLQSNIMAIAAGSGQWRRAASSWWALLPTAWRAPNSFVHSQLRLGEVFAELVKRPIRRMVRR